MEPREEMWRDARSISREVESTLSCSCFAASPAFTLMLGSPRTLLKSVARVVLLAGVLLSCHVTGTPAPGVGLPAPGPLPVASPGGYKCLDLYDELQYPSGEGHFEMCVERNGCVNVPVNWLRNIRALNTRGRSFMVWEHHGCKGESYLYNKLGRVSHSTPLPWYNGISSVSYVYDEQDHVPGTPPSPGGATAAGAGVPPVPGGIFVGRNMESGGGGGGNSSTSTTPPAAPAAPAASTLLPASPTEASLEERERAVRANATDDDSAQVRAMSSAMSAASTTTTAVTQVDSRLMRRGSADGHGFHCLEMTDRPATDAATAALPAAPSAPSRSLVLCGDIEECVNVMPQWLGRVQDLHVGDLGGTFVVYERPGCKGESFILHLQSKSSLGRHRANWGYGRISSMMLINKL